MHKQCPDCKKVARGQLAIEADFGFRLQSCGYTPQSHCRACRNRKRHAPKKFKLLKELTKGELKILYAKEYPNDKAGAKRSENFMKERLHKRLERKSHKEK